MTVTYEEYDKDKRNFFKKHNNDFKVTTSPMDEYGRYFKEYSFSDNAVWYESMSPTYEKGTVEIKKVSVEVQVKMFRTEYWNTEDSKSKFYYQKF